MMWIYNNWSKGCVVFILLNIMLLASSQQITEGDISVYFAATGNITANNSCEYIIGLFTVPIDFDLYNKSQFYYFRDNYFIYLKDENFTENLLGYYNISDFFFYNSSYEKYINQSYGGEIARLRVRKHSQLLGAAIRLPRNKTVVFNCTRITYINYDETSQDKNATFIVQLPERNGISPIYLINISYGDGVAVSGANPGGLSVLILYQYGQQSGYDCNATQEYADLWIKIIEPEYLGCSCSPIDRYICAEYTEPYNFTYMYILANYLREYMDRAIDPQCFTLGFPWDPEICPFLRTSLGDINTEFYQKLLEFNSSFYINYTNILTHHKYIANKIRDRYMKIPPQMRKYIRNRIINKIENSKIYEDLYILFKFNDTLYISPRPYISYYTDTNRYKTDDSGFFIPKNIYGLLFEPLDFNSSMAQIDINTSAKGEILLTFDETGYFLGNDSYFTIYREENSQDCFKYEPAGNSLICYNNCIYITPTLKEIQRKYLDRYFSVVYPYMADFSYSGYNPLCDIYQFKWVWRSGRFDYERLKQSQYIVLPESSFNPFYIFCYQTSIFRLNFTPRC